MRSTRSNWICLGVVVMAISMTQVGCKSGMSGWKVPGSDYFSSWGKKPSESTLTGSNPSLSLPSSSSGPSSPGLRNTPNQIASSAANNGRPSSPYGAVGSVPSTGYGANAGVGGAAATANGYPTGNYAMGSQTRPANVASLPQGPYTPPGGYGPNGLASNPSPATGYGAPAGYSAPAGSMPQLPPGGNPMASMPTTNASYPPPGMPNMNSAPSYAPVGATVPALPAGYNATNSGSIPMPSSMPNTVPASVPAMPNANYRPGSVGRPTSYDFSGQGATGGLPTSGASAGLPGSYPTSASGSSGTIYR